MSAQALDPSSIVQLAPVRPGRLCTRVDLLRLDASRRLDPKRRIVLGQFLTPAAVARFMASLFEMEGEHIRLLDAGAGVGSLTAAFVEEMCGRVSPPSRLSVVAFEVEARLCEYLSDTFAMCREACSEAGIGFECRTVQDDFLAASISDGAGGLFRGTESRRFDCAILNPPYRKIAGDSRERRLLRSLGVETSNLYAGFVAAVMHWLAEGGELVSITPRSFCNGPYFRSFRAQFLAGMTLRRLHVFGQRDRAFEDDDVLQENIVLHATRGGGEGGAGRSGSVTVSLSATPSSDTVEQRVAAYAEVVAPDDPERVIHLPATAIDAEVAATMRNLRHTLGQLRLSVSTGPVVEFRARTHIVQAPRNGAVPLIYPAHLRDGSIAWPDPSGRRPNALLRDERTEALLLPSATYVLVKRFSAKEERRRLVAAVFEPERVPGDLVAFENHVNYFHENGKGLSGPLARGLVAYLNSTLVDTYFRQFNGHTQVNAADLRNMQYPSRQVLERLGRRIGEVVPGQDEVDRLVEEGLIGMSEKTSGRRAVAAKKKIAGALEILRALGLPREQQNERSALTLLALLGLSPSTPWKDATAPLRGITEMMEFFAEHYGKKYAPNTRETVRRFTVHQFVQAGLVTENPDAPERPVNSPKTVYQVRDSVLELLRAYGPPSGNPGSGDTSRRSRPSGTSTRGSGNSHGSPCDSGRSIRSGRDRLRDGVSRSARDDSVSR